MARETEAALVGEVLASWDDEESGCWVLRAACVRCNIEYVCSSSLIPGKGDAFRE